MSLGQFWATLRAAWLRIALMVLVASSITFVLASGLPKQYTAKARVMLNLDNTDPTQFSALGRGMAAPYIGTEMRLVADPAVTRAVAIKLGWPENPQVVTAWQAETGGVGDIAAWAGYGIGQGINAQQLQDSAIIEIYYSSSSLDAAKQMVAEIRTAYIDQSQRLRAEAARRAAAWNRTQAARALAIVQSAEAARAAFVTANQIAVDTPVGGLDYEAQTSALAVAVAHDSSAATTVVNPTAAALRRRLDDLIAELAVQRLRGEENPATLALEVERSTVAQQLAREDAVTLNGPNATEQQIGLVRQQRDAAYLEARLRLIDRAPLYNKLAAIDRDIALKTQRYTAAAGRIASFEAVAAAPSGLKVIGDVIAKDDATFPNIPLMVAIAGGSSFALGIAVAVLGELARRQVRGVEDLRFFAAAPVLAVIAGDPRRGRWRSVITRIATLRWRTRREAIPRGNVPA